MDAESKIRILISSALSAKGFDEATASTEKLKQKAKEASRGIGGINDTLDILKSRAESVVQPLHTVQGIFAAYGVGTVVKSLIDINAQFESMQTGISALIAVNAQNETSTGRAISTQEKFNLAQKESANVVELLRKANIETPATLAELTDGFQAAVGPALKLNWSLEQTVKYTTLMTQAAAAMGMPMNQLAQEMRSVLSGQIDMNSQVARNLGITNDQIAQHIKLGDTYSFLMTKLQDFEVAGAQMASNWEGITSNLKDGFDSVKKKAGENLFGALKTDLVELNTLFSQNSDQIAGEFSEGLMTAYNAGKTLVGGLYEMRGTIDNVVVGYAAFKVGGMIATGIATATTAIVAMNTALKTATVAQLAFNVAAKANPYILGATIIGTLGYAAYEAMSTADVEVQKTYEESSAYWTKIANENTEKAKTQEGMLKTAESYELKYQEIFEKTGQRIEAYKTQAEQLRKMAADASLSGGGKLKFNGKTLTDEEAKSQSLAAVKSYEDYYKSIGDLASAWGIKENDIRNKNTALSEAQLQKLLSAEKQEYIDGAKITKDRKKLNDDYYDYVADLSKISTEKKVDQEVLSEAYKYQKFLDEHKLSNDQKIALEKNFLGAIDRIQTEAQKDTLKKQEDALLEYYKAIGNEVKAGEIQLKRYKEELDKTNLTQPQKDQMFSVAQKDYDRTALQKQLEQNERYYEAIGDYALAAQMKIEKFRLELEKDNFSPDQIEKIVAAEEKAIAKTNAFSSVRLQSVTTASEALEIYKERVVANTQSYGEQIVTIMENVSNGMNNSFESFFDTQSDNFMDFRNLSKNIMNDIYMSIMKTMVIQPLVSSITSGISSAGISLVKAYDGGYIPYAAGGYTGDGGKYEPKGIVHGGEYVIPQWMVKQNKPLVSALEVTRRKGYAEGGSVGGSISTAQATSGNIKIQIINQSGSQMEVTNTKKTVDAEGEVIQLWISGISKNRYGSRDLLGGN